LFTNIHNHEKLTNFVFKENRSMMKNRVENKNEAYKLAIRLKALGALWSYSPDVLDSLPESLLIEEALRYGDVPEIKMIFSLYPLKLVRQIWREKLIPDQRIYGHNVYLASIFFNIENPKRYILPLQKKLSRYERIKKFTA
jgi:hypothetical protein